MILSVFILLVVSSIVYMYYSYKKYQYEIKQLRENHRIQQLKKEEQRKSYEKQLELDQQRVQRKIEPQVYQLNTTALKFELYSKDIFRHKHIREIYGFIILDNFLFEEPFYSDIVKILSVLDNSELFIKSHKSKSMKINTRDENGNLVQSESFKVVSLIEVSYDFLPEVHKFIKLKAHTSKKSQLRFISLTLFVITKSYQVQSKYEGMGTKEIFLELIELLLQNNKKDILEHLESVSYYQENSWINDSYNDAIDASREYPYVQPKNYKVEKLKVPQIAEKIVCALD